jgi:phosphate-selective porin OprO/OprP
MAVNSALTLDLEVSWRKGPFWVATEIVGSEAEVPMLENPFFSGYHVSGSWILTGEMRSYNKRNGVFGPTPVAKSVPRWV